MKLIAMLNLIVGIMCAIVYIVTRDQFQANFAIINFIMVVINNKNI
jgi:hypothetical protein